MFTGSIKKKIMKLINGQDYDIPLTTPELQEHFSNPYNYTKEIIAQFEHNYYREFIPDKCKAMLDIGANVGLFALHMSMLPVIEKIICVEPTPEHFKNLEELTSPFPFIKREQSALAGHSGRTIFHWCGINTTMNSLQPRGDRSFEVNAITLSDLLDKYKLDSVDFCKIDIEGSEDVAVTAETLTPVKDRIKKIFIELHPPNGESQTKFQKIFEAVGYKVERIYHDSLLCTI